MMRARGQDGERVAKRLVLSLKFATETGGGVVLFPDDFRVPVRECRFGFDARDARFGPSRRRQRSPARVRLRAKNESVTVAEGLLLRPHVGEALRHGAVG